MTSGYVLLDSPNPHGDHFYRSRRSPLLAVVLHITAGLEDLDGIDDHSAERTARYAATTDRKVSWHSGSDSDSALDLLPADYTAWHARGYNSCTYGHEISKRYPDWRSAPPEWVAATLHQAAAHLAPKAVALSIPARHATRSELDDVRTKGGPPVGFVGHHQLDQDRRSDPGMVGNLDTFPWDQFLGLVTAQLSGRPEEAEMVLTRIGVSVVDFAAHPAGGGYWFLDEHGGVFNFGTAPFRGSIGTLRENGQAIPDVRFTALAPTPTGGGYWVVDEHGGVFTFGDARYRGSVPAQITSGKIAGPPPGRAVALASTPTGDGYWVVFSSGHLFTFGDATYHSRIEAAP